MCSAGVVVCSSACLCGLRSQVGRCSIWYIVGIGCVMSVSLYMAALFVSCVKKYCSDMARFGTDW